MRAESPIKRRKSRQIMVGNVPVGGDAPISVQSMTNTETRDVEATVAQIRRLKMWVQTLFVYRCRAWMRPKRLEKSVPR